MDPTSSPAVEAACDVLELIASCGTADAGAPAVGSLTSGDWAAVAAVACSGDASVAASLWPGLSSRNVTPSALGSGLCSLVTGPSKAEALCAGACYSALLGSPECPVFSVFNAVAFEGTLKVLRDAAAVVATAALADKAGGRKAKAAKAAKAAALAAAAQRGDEDMDDEDALMEDAFGDDAGGDGLGAAAVSPEAAASSAAAILSGLVRTLAVLPLRDAPEAHKHAVEALTAVAGVPPAAGGDLQAQALAVLRLLLRPDHGDVLPSAASQMQRLSPVLLASSGRGSAGAAVLEYVRSVAASVPQARQATAALVRHLCLRCGDKADMRARATEAAAVLLGALPRSETAAFITFLGRLSRSATAAHRGFATDLAPVLLSRLPEPFATPEPWGAEEVGGAPTPGPATSLGAKTPATGRSAHTPVPGAGVASVEEGTWSPALPAGATPGTPAAGPRQPWGVVCMQLLVQRASDKVPAVRARALSALAEAAGLAPDAAEDTSALQRLLGASVPDDGLAAGQQGGGGHLGGAATPGSGLRAAAGEGLGRGITPGTVLFLRRCGRTPGAESDSGRTDTVAPSSGGGGGVLPAPSPLSGGASSLSELLCLRARDEKGGVRRAALGALEAVALATGAVSPADMAATAGGCSDALLSVRKAAHGALCRLLAAHPDAPGLASTWLTHALPLVGDAEPGVCEPALDAAEQLLLGGIAAWGKRGATATASACVADALLRALGTADAACTAAVASTVAALARRGRVKPATLAALQARLGATSFDAAEAPGAWVLLAEVTEAIPNAADTAFLQAAWDAARASGGPTTVSPVVVPSLLRAVAAAAPRFGEAAAAAMAGQLERAVTAQFTLAPAVAAAHLRACAALASQARGAGTTAGWAGRVFAAAAAALEPLVSASGVAGAPQQVRPQAESSARGALLAAGTVALLAPGAVPGELVTLVQALVAATDGSSSSPAASGVAPHAWAALTKLCLADERLAKRCVPLFVRELSAARCPAVRNNLLVGLADLCVHYTALVDPHAMRLAGCLSDPCELVRRQALALLASLLQRDYLKWKGQLFVRFAAALADDSPGVRGLAASLLADPQLAPRVPLLAYNHFSEALFSLNGFDGGAASACAGRSAPQQEKSTLAMGGSDGDARAKRLEVLRSLLRAMTTEHRLATASKLCAEVLVPVAEGTLPLPACNEVLADALAALASKEMSFKAAAAKAGAAVPGDDDDGDEAGGAGEQGAQLAHAKARVVSTLAKRNVVEHFVPVLIELRTLLTAQKSPLLGHLMACARTTLRDFKDELEDILVADRQMAAELAFDLRHGGNEQTGADKAPAGRQQQASRAQPMRGSRRPAAAMQTPGAAAGVSPLRPSPAGNATATPGGAAALAAGAAVVAPMSVPRIRATPRTVAPPAPPPGPEDAGLDFADIRRRQSFSQAAFGDENAGGAAPAAPKVVHFLSPDRVAPPPPRCLNLPLPAGIAFGEGDEAQEMDVGVRGTKRTRA